MKTKEILKRAYYALVIKMKKSDKVEIEKLRKKYEKNNTSYDIIHYHMVYQLIPYIIDKLANNFESGYKLEKTDNWKYFFGGMMANGIISREEIWAFPWDEIWLETFERRDKGRILYVYTFPTPRRMPQAKFGIVSIDFESRQIEYITLERSGKTKIERGPNPELNTNLQWMLGSTYQQENGSLMRLNYGPFNAEPSLDNFMQAAIAILNMPVNERHYMVNNMDA